MEVRKWLEKPENVKKLKALCLETEVFMELPMIDNGQRRGIWERLESCWSDEVKEVLSLTGNVVMRKFLVKGDLYAGAVLHKILKNWLEIHSPFLEPVQHSFLT